MTRKEQIAWAAGVIEGEGCIYKRTHIKGKNKNIWVYPGLSVESVDKDVIYRLQDIFNAGTVIEFVPTTGLGKQMTYRWRIQNRSEFQKVANLIRPFLSKRRLAKLREVEKAMTPASGHWNARRAA